MRRMMNKRALRSMAGLTLLETMFAIALGVLVLIAAVVFFSSGKQSTGANKTVEDLNSIVSGYQSYVAMGTPLKADGSASPTAPLASLTGTYKAVQAAGFLPAALIDTVGQGYKVTYQLSSGGVIKGKTGASLNIEIPGVKKTDPLCNAVDSMLKSEGHSTNAGGAIVGNGANCTATMYLSD